MLYNAVSFFIYLSIILFLAKIVAGRAENLASRFGEPYGTMILTLSAVAVEVILIGIMMSHSHNPHLARDTVYSALMFDIAGILGVAAILGGWKHFEQKHNGDGTNAYLTTIFVMSGIVMFMPSFMPAKANAVHGVFASISCLIMYGLFLFAQTKRHKSYFQYTSENSAHEADNHGPWVKDAAVMFVSIALIGYCSENLSGVLEPISDKLGLPSAAIGLLIAAISASSEIMTAIRAALKNNMQAAVNIALGASVATLLLTVPAVEVISYMHGKDISLGLSTTQMMMLAMTMAGAYMTLEDGETNVLEGASLLALFSGFCLLSFYS